MKLRPNQIYILPTGHGFTFLASVVVMILTAATYNNNLIYILAFILFGVLLVSMVQTHVNLKGIDFHSCQIPDVASGTDVTVTIALQNSTRATRETLMIGSRKWPMTGTLDFLKPQEVERVNVRLPAVRRGKHTLSTVDVSTIYPLGLFRAWKVLAAHKDYFVFPTPLGDRPLSDCAIDAMGMQSQQAPRGQADGADFYEHRAFQTGDSFQHVDWKAYARNRPLLVKQFEGESQRAYGFEVRPLRGEALENELSQVAQWILSAELEGAAYAVKVGSHVIAMGSGFEHCQECLRQLALYRGGDGY